MPWGASRPQVGGDAAGHDETDPATSPLAIEGGQLVKAPFSSSRPVCMDPINTRLRSRVKAEVEGSAAWITAHHELLVGAGLEAPCPDPPSPKARRRRQDGRVAHGASS